MHGQVRDPEQWALVVPAEPPLPFPWSRDGDQGVPPARAGLPCRGVPCRGAQRGCPWRLLPAGRERMPGRGCQLPPLVLRRAASSGAACCSLLCGTQPAVTASMSVPPLGNAGSGAWNPLGSLMKPALKGWGRLCASASRPPQRAGRRQIPPPQPSVA